MPSTRQKTSHSANMAPPAERYAKLQRKRRPFLRDGRTPGRLHQSKGAGPLPHKRSIRGPGVVPGPGSRARFRLPDAHRIMTAARFLAATTRQENAALVGSFDGSFEPELQLFPPERGTRAAVYADTGAEYGPSSVRLETSSRPDQRNYP